MFEKEIQTAQADVMVKLNELQIASDTLAIWKTKAALAFNKSQEAACNTEVAQANMKATRVIRYKKTGYSVATLKRKKMFALHLRQQGLIYMSFESVQKHVEILGRDMARFRWCRNLSEISILGLFNFCKEYNQK